MKLPRINRAQRRLFDDICKFCRQHNRKHAIRNKSVAKVTSHTRFLHLVRSLVIDLHATGRRKERLQRLKPRDIVALIQYWEGRISGQTIRNRLSTLRWLCRTLNKPGIMPKDPRIYMEDPSNYDIPSAAKAEVTPTAKGVDVGAYLCAVFEKDVLVGLVQLLKIEWGLRRREAIMTRPHEQDKGDYFLVTRRRGPKGGRPRAISHYNFESRFDEVTGEFVIMDPRIDPVKRQILELLKRFTNSRGSLIPDEYSLTRWMRWERTVTAEYCGLSSKALGITSHKFRHEYAQVRGEIVSGLTRQFGRDDPLTSEESGRDQVARRIVTEELGHSDRATMNCYAGRARNRAPSGFVKKMEAAFNKRLPEPIIRRDADGRLVGGSGMKIRIVYSDAAASDVDRRHKKSP